MDASRPMRRMTSRTISTFIPAAWSSTSYSKGGLTKVASTSGSHRPTPARQETNTAQAVNRSRP